MNRTYYDYGPLTTTFAVHDAGYYNGWTGGTFVASPFPIQGTWLTSKSTANFYCKLFTGSQNAKVAEHHDGWYMPYMNTDPSQTTGANWQWQRRGGWTGWGPFGSGITQGSTESYWTWIDRQNGNCGTAN